MSTEKQNKSEKDWRPYWEMRLQMRPDVGGTGHRAFSMKYNEYMYLVATENMQRGLKRAGVEVKGKRVLDAGAGLGYFVRRFIEWGAAEVTGLDLTDFSVQNLSQMFPEQKFVRADLSEPNLPLPGNYDLVTAISMLFHIVEDDKFERAVTNLCQQTKPGGHLLLVDTFYKPIVVSAGHANPRPLEKYIPILERNGCRVKVIQTMYHFYGQTLVPVIGPAIMNLPPVMELMLKGERWMAEHRPDQRGFLQYLIVEKAA